MGKKSPALMAEAKEPITEQALALRDEGWSWPDIGIQLGQQCPGCERPYGDHADGCPLDQHEDRWAVWHLQDRLASFEGGVEGTSDPVPSLKRAA